MPAETLIKLYEACVSGDSHMLRDLLAGGADPNANLAPVIPGNLYREIPALLVAAREWHADAVKLLLDAGADPGWKGPVGRPWDGPGEFDIGSNVLMLAMENLKAAHGRTADFERTVGLLAGAGCSPDQRNLSNVTALNVAIINGANEQTLRFLLGFCTFTSPTVKPSAASVAVGYLNLDALRVMRRMEQADAGDPAQMARRGVLLKAAAGGPAQMIGSARRDAYGGVREIPALLDAASPDGGERLVSVFRELLKELGEDRSPEHYDPDGSVLQAAAFRGSMALASFLTGQVSSEAQVRRVNGALFAAAQTHNVAMMRMLLEAGASVHARRERGETLLHAAAVRSRADYDPAECDGMVAYLTQQGLDINVADDSGATALHAAAWTGSVQALEMLTRHGIDLERREAGGGKTALMLAAEQLRAPLVAELLSLGADPLADTDGNGQGMSALHLVARRVVNTRNPAVRDTVRILVNAGVDPNRLSRGSATPLRLAVEAGNTEAVAALLVAGADPFMPGDRVGLRAINEPDGAQTLVDRAAAHALVCAAQARASLGGAACGVDASPVG